MYRVRKGQSELEIEREKKLPMIKRDDDEEMMATKRLGFQSLQLKRESKVR